MLQPRHVRAVRGVATAIVATFVALVSHVTGGGAMPGALGVVVPAVLAVFVSVLLAGRRLSMWRMSLSVMVSQVLFHLLFVLGTPTTPLEQSSGHHGHGAIDMSVVSSSSMTSHAMHGDPTMWFHHAAAAAVTIMLIARGERILAGLAAFGWFVLRRFIPTSWLPVALARDPARVVRSTPHVRTLSQRSAPALLRGPPVAVAS